jgi:hypothetical protein
MSTQIFKNIIPKNKLYELLDLICIKTDKNYILNKDAFKKGMFNNKIKEFWEVLHEKCFWKSLLL